MTVLFLIFFSHNAKMTQYEHPAKTQFLQQQHPQEMHPSENGCQDSQAIPAQNPLVPASPYISEGTCSLNAKFLICRVGF